MLRAYLQMNERVRELALFNPGINSKLRGCDFAALKSTPMSWRGYVSRLHGWLP